MWFRQEAAKLPDICQGARFSRSSAAGVVETAYILAISTDMGIPHVRFLLSIRGPRLALDEQRTLSLASFRLRYPTAVPDDVPAEHEPWLGVAAPEYNESPAY
jgi:hypothetical protein